MSQQQTHGSTASPRPYPEKTAEEFAADADRFCDFVRIGNYDGCRIRLDDERAVELVAPKAFAGSDPEEGWEPSKQVSRKKLTNINEVHRLLEDVWAGQPVLVTGTNGRGSAEIRYLAVIIRAEDLAARQKAPPRSEPLPAGESVGPPAVEPASEPETAQPPLRAVEEGEVLTARFLRAPTNDLRLRTGQLASALESLDLAGIVIERREAGGHNPRPRAVLVRRSAAYTGRGEAKKLRQLGELLPNLEEHLNSYGFILATKPETVLLPVSYFPELAFEELEEIQLRRPAAKPPQVRGQEPATEPPAPPAPEPEPEPPTPPAEAIAPASKLRPAQEYALEAEAARLEARRVLGENQGLARLLLDYAGICLQLAELQARVENA